jgi:hypothetical protein
MQLLFDSLIMGPEDSTTNTLLPLSFSSWHFLINTLLMAICTCFVKECVNKPPSQQKPKRTLYQNGDI